MEISALSSGSSGNCFYVGNEKTAVLIDVGISARQVVERLARIGGNPEKIKAIFITHEHTDHVKGADVLARSLNIPIFATKDTARNCFLCSNKSLINYIGKNQVVKIGKLKVEAFSKSHSAADPVSYNIYEKKKVSVITDAGYVCKNIKEHLSDCDSLFIESNHDEKMLHLGPYSETLKEWISSDQGHLSNEQAAYSIVENASPRLKTIILSHLSKTNNTPELAFSSFSNIIKDRKGLKPTVHVSVRERPTKLFRV